VISLDFLYLTPKCREKKAFADHPGL